MRDSERIKVIEAILLRQVDYLAGCRFRVTVKDSAREIFLITFEKMTNRQLQTLRGKLQEYSLEHIEVTAKEIVEERDPEKELPVKKKRYKRYRHKTNNRPHSS